jgi:flagellar protein FliO/FliZ
MRVLLRGWFILTAILFAMPALALAQTAPTSQSAAAANPIHRSSASGTSGSSTSTETSGWHVAFSLAAVLTLIVILYFISRRILPGGAFAGSSSTSRAVQILARTPLGPKHRILLVQVGRRILVIAESPGQPLSTLCQITDPDEAAALIGQLGGDQRGAMTAFLEKASNPTPQQSPDSSELATTRQELDGLLQQVRTMAQQIGRA